MRRCYIRKLLLGNICVRIISFVVILTSSSCGDKESPAGPEDEINGVQNYCGSLIGQEAGDAFYNRLTVPVLLENSHAGIYYRYTGGDPNDKRNHLVIDHPGYGDRVRIRSWFDALNGIEEGYWGAYNPGAYGKIGFQNRVKVLRTAIELVQAPPIPYVFLHALYVPDELKPQWTGEIYQIWAIRCDGVVEYCYEANEIRVWGVDLDSGRWDITANANNLDDHNRADLPIDPSKELTPDVQRGCVQGSKLSYTEYTYMRDSQPEDPSPVSNLTATTTSLDPIDPCDNRIKITWTDATDLQSGIWGYYIKVDKSATSIPSFEDISLPRIDVNDNDPAFPQREDYHSEWTSPPLEAGIYYVHIRSVDNAGNWCETWPWGCTVHTMPLVIETCDNDSIPGDRNWTPGSWELQWSDRGTSYFSYESKVAQLLPDNYPDIGFLFTPDPLGSGSPQAIVFVNDISQVPLNVPMECQMHIDFGIGSSGELHSPIDYKNDDGVPPAQTYVTFLQLDLPEGLFPGLASGYFSGNLQVLHKPDPMDMETSWAENVVIIDAPFDSVRVYAESGYNSRARQILLR